jgi:hypothetical protein
MSTAVLTRSVWLAGVQDASEHGKMGNSEDTAVYQVRSFACGTLNTQGFQLCVVRSCDGSSGQEGAGGLENYCSITIDGSGGLSEDILQQRLQSIVRQREELQQVEIELRTQALVLEAQRSFQAAAKEHVTAAAKLKVAS